MKNNFKVGDIVIVSKGVDSNWDGVECVVIENPYTPLDLIRIKKIGNRANDTWNEGNILPKDITKKTFQIELDFGD